MFVFGRAFAFKKTLLGRFDVVRYLSMTVGFETMGLGVTEIKNLTNLGPWSHETLWEKHMSLKLKDLGVNGTLKLK